MKLVNMLVAVAFFTSSFDIFLVINAGGTVRFAQLMMLVVVVAAAAKIVQSQTILWPRGGSALALWCILQGFLLVQSDSIVISLELYLLLLFIVAGLFATLQLYGLSAWIDFLMRTYLLSFVFVACFGLVQLVSPALHLGAPLVVQWIKKGVFPRINGFSYEPSYFATYLLLGWAALIDLRLTRARLTRSRRWFWFAVILSMALILSTSKTAWLIMAMEGAARIAPSSWNLVRKQMRRLSAGSLIVPLPRIRILLSIGMVVVLAATVVFVVLQIVNPMIFLAGTGLNNSSAHSVTERYASFQDTLQVIHEHFWIGRSLGGVADSIAKLHGETINSVAQLRMHWGFPVIVDVFAASGFFGFLPFAWFLIAITAGERRLIKREWADERSKWLHALIRGFFIELIALLADQNLLRIYLWFHITMIMVVAYNLRHRSRSSEANIESERLALA